MPNNTTTAVNPFDAQPGDIILATIDQIAVTVTAVTPCRDGAIRITGTYRTVGGKRTSNFYFYA